MSHVFAISAFVTNPNIPDRMLEFYNLDDAPQPLSFYEIDRLVNLYKDTFTNKGKWIEPEMKKPTFFLNGKYVSVKTTLI